MREIAHCPFCHSNNTQLIQFERRQWAVVCDDCGATGPIARIPVKAREVWGLVIPANNSSSEMRK